MSLIFAVDMGNTHIVAGCLRDGEVIFRERISTIKGKTAFEYAADFRIMFEMYGVKPSDLEGAVLSSVVPPLTDTLREACVKACGITPVVVGPGVRSGLQIRIDNPAELGADLVAGAVAALAEYKPPMILIDLGTATTISVINDRSQFIGVTIMPGIMTGLNSLSGAASQLIGVSVTAPKRTVGRNTAESLKSGAVFGTAAMIDGLIDRICEECGFDKPAVVATGGLAGAVIPHCRHQILIDDGQILKGLGIIWERNRS